MDDQSSCASGWALSAVGALEGAWFIKTGELVHFSVQRVLDCSGSFGNDGCNGGWMESAFRYAGYYGLVSESCYPYMARDQPCKTQCPIIAMPKGLRCALSGQFFYWVKAKILQASTSEIYGDPTVNPQREEYWGNVNCNGPRACYDEGKRVAESLFFSYYYQSKVDIKVVRIFNTDGPRMNIPLPRLPKLLSA